MAKTALATPAERVAALAPLVADLRESFDTDRRLPEPLLSALREADLFRLTTPKSFGGSQLVIRDWLGVIEGAARLDASLAWVLTNTAILGRLAGFLPEAVARAWFATPDCAIAGSTAALGQAIPVKRGLRVSGVWPFASGIHAATRVMGLCELAGEDDPARRIICAFLPIESVEIADDWHASGLRGSGSCTFSARDVFIPTEHSAAFVAYAPRLIDDPYHLPHLSIFPLSVTMVALGIVGAALEDVRQLADRARGGTSAKLAEREMVQTDIGRAVTLHRAARALVLDCLSDLEAAFSGDADRTMARAMFRAALAQAAELCESAMAIIVKSVGTTAILQSSPLERRQRDLQAAARHIAMGPHNLTLLGRVHLGLDAGTIRF